jgi:hypothetical protein
MANQNYTTYDNGYKGINPLWTRPVFMTDNGYKGLNIDWVRPENKASQQVLDKTDIFLRDDHNADNDDVAVPSLNDEYDVIQQDQQKDNMPLRNLPCITKNEQDLLKDQWGKISILYNSQEKESAKALYLTKNFGLHPLASVNTFWFSVGMDVVLFNEHDKELWDEMFAKYNAKNNNKDYNENVYKLWNILDIYNEQKNKDY